MAYKNPKPGLHYDRTSAGAVPPQEKSVAEYAPRKEVYFAFIDVLGFKQTFDENRDSDEEFAIAYREVFQYFSLLMNNAKYSGTVEQWSSGQTSDSLYFYTNRPDCLAAFIKIYSHFCLYAMSKDVFFRGGIAKGNLFVDKPYQFYGDSVIKAYLLESTIAKYPQIVIDQSVFSDLQKEEGISKLLVGQDPPRRNYIKPFINITEGELKSLVSISDTEIRSITESELELIQSTIQKNMDRFEFDDKTYQKYAFLQTEYKKFSASRNKK